MLDFDRNRIIQRLDCSAALLRSIESTTPHDYQSLKTVIIHQELQKEVDFLKSIVASRAFPEQFRQRCQERATQNRGTCLSFIEMPYGEVNKLYWDIAHELFKFKTMEEALQVLWPEVTRYVMPAPRIMDTSKPKRTHNIAIPFEVKTLAMLEAPCSLKSFTRFTIVGDTLLDISDIARYDFKLHQTYYMALSKEYPRLVSPFYSHNPALQTLSRHVAWASNNGQTPYQALVSLIQALRLGGTRMTGNEYANIGAQLAFTEFMAYLGALPPETKEALLPLTEGTNTRTLATVIEHLNREDCVETAAQWLQNIIDNPANQVILNTSPSLTADYLQRLTRGYGLKKPLPTRAEDSTQALPQTLLERSCTQLKIETAFEYISLLLSFPTELYTLLFQYAQINEEFPSTLLELIRNGILNQEQKQAFHRAIFINASRYNESSLEHFMRDNEEPGLLLALLQACPPERRLETVKNKFGKTLFRQAASSHPELLCAILDIIPDDHRLESVTDTYCILHLSAAHPQSLEKILALYPSSAARLNVIKAKDPNGNTVLHSAVGYPESLKAILGSFSEPERFEAVKEKHHYGQCSVLHKIASYPESLRAVLDCLSEPDRLIAVREQDKHGNTVLHLTVGNLDSLGIVLALYPDNTARLNAIKERGRGGYTVLHAAAGLPFPESLCSLLALYPDDIARFTAIQERNIRGEAVLYMAAPYPATLQTLLALYPTDKARLDAVMERNALGETMLHKAAPYPESLAIILALVPEQERFALVQEKDHTGNSMLNHGSSLPTILALLPAADRLRVFKETDQNGYTTLSRMANYPGFLRDILTSLPEDTRLLVVKEKDSAGRTLLYNTARYPESLKTIIALFSEHDYLEAVRERMNTYGHTVLHHAAQYPESLKTILALYPNDEARLEAILEKDRCGESLLDFAEHNFGALKVILSSLQGHHRFKVVKEKNRYGYTMLHVAANKYPFHGMSVTDGPALKAFLDLLPDNRTRLEAIQEKDKDGCTVFYNASRHLCLMKILLAMYPEEKRFPALLKDRQQNTLRKIHASQAKAEILALLPTNHAFYLRCLMHISVMSKVASIVAYFGLMLLSPILVPSLLVVEGLRAFGMFSRKNTEVSGDHETLVAGHVLS